MIAPLLALAVLAAEPKSLPFDLKALRALPQVEVKVTDRGETTTYTGVPLRTLLKEELGDAGMAQLKELADAVVTVEAADGYRVAYSAAALAMDEDGSKYLLAFTKNGKPLGDEGPARVIVPGEAQHVRWIRNVKGAELGRPEPARPAKRPTAAKP